MSSSLTNKRRVGTSPAIIAGSHSPVVLCTDLPFEHRLVLRVLASLRREGVSAPTMVSIAPDGSQPKPPTSPLGGLLLIIALRLSDAMITFLDVCQHSAPVALVTSADPFNLKAVARIRVPRLILDVEVEHELAALLHDISGWYGHVQDLARDVSECRHLPFALRLALLRCLQMVYDGTPPVRSIRELASTLGCSDRHLRALAHSWKLDLLLFLRRCLVVTAVRQHELLGSWSGAAYHLEYGSASALSELVLSVTGRRPSSWEAPQLASELLCNLERMIAAMIAVPAR